MISVFFFFIDITALVTEITPLPLPPHTLIKTRIIHMWTEKLCLVHSSCCYLLCHFTALLSKEIYTSGETFRAQYDTQFSCRNIQKKFDAYNQKQLNEEMAKLDVDVSMMLWFSAIGYAPKTFSGGGRREGKAQAYWTVSWLKFA